MLNQLGLNNMNWAFFPVTFVNSRWKYNFWFQDFKLPLYQITALRTIRFCFNLFYLAVSYQDIYKTQYGFDRISSFINLN